MRYFCVVMLLVSAIGSADGFVTAEQKRPDGEQPRADIPEAFRFLFHSVGQRVREAAKRPTYWEDLWKGLPYDSISLERGLTEGCLRGPCSTVTLYRATVSGIRRPAPCLTAPCLPGELRGRAELRTVEAVSAAPAFLLPPPPLQPPPVRISEGSVDIYSFANLSYLLHKLRFLELPDVYEMTDRFHAPFERMTVVASGKAKAVTHYQEGIPVELWAIQEALDSVATRIQWTQK